MEASTTAPPGEGGRPPLRRDAQRNRERILAAARELFAARGLEVSVDDIAAAAGVGVGTVYRRFPDRERLVEALFEERMLDYLALAEEAAEDDDAWAGLVAYLERSLQMRTADRALHELLVRGDHAALRGQAEAIRERLTPLLEDLVHRAREQGALRADVEPLDMPLFGIMLCPLAAFSDEFAPGLWRRYLTIILDGLRARPGAPSELPRPAIGERELSRAMAAWHEAHHR